MREKILSVRTVNVRMPEREFSLLAQYAAALGRTKSEVIREFVRSLEPTREQKMQKTKRASTS